MQKVLANIGYWVATEDFFNLSSYTSEKHLPENGTTYNRIDHEPERSVILQNDYISGPPEQSRTSISIARLKKKSFPSWPSV